MWSYTRCVGQGGAGRGVWEGYADFLSEIIFMQYIVVFSEHRAHHTLMDVCCRVDLMGSVLQRTFLQRDTLSRIETFISKVYVTVKIERY